MANVVSTYGTTESFVKSALMGLGATQQDPNGRFYLDGNMVNVELSQVIAEAIYIEEIFRDGQSVTGKYTADRKAGAVCADRAAAAVRTGRFCPPTRQGLRRSCLRRRMSCPRRWRNLAPTRARATGSRLWRMR